MVEPLFTALARRSLFKRHTTRASRGSRESQWLVQVVRQMRRFERCRHVTGHQFLHGRLHETLELRAGLFCSADEEAAVLAGLHLPLNSLEDKLPVCFWAG